MSFSISCPSNRTCPSLGRSMPVMILTVVDLPAPLGTEKADDLARRHAKAYILNGWDAAVASVEMLDFEHGWGPRVNGVRIWILADLR